MLTSAHKSAQWFTAAAITAIATTVAAGAAYADPAPAGGGDNDALSAQILPGVQYTSNLADGSVVINTPLGTLTTRGEQFQVQDAAGVTVAGTAFADAPLAATDSTASQSGTGATQVAATSIDGTDTAAATPVAAAPDPSDRFNQALGVVGGQFGLASGVGAMAGGLTGLAVGCVAGALTGGSLFIPVSAGTLSLPAAAAGCVAGGVMLLAIGGAVGGALVGIPVGIAALAQMQQKLNTPAPASQPVAPAA